MKNFLLSSTLIIVFTTLSFGLSAQNYSISGTQAKGHAGQNASLKCTAVKITQTVSAYKVEGNNAGFWILKDGGTFKKFWTENDPNVKALSFTPGTYYVYPNIKANQNSAIVKLYLK
ncbi:MAG: hypothetical protein U9N85_02495 [Bacteroidota bacterium]|nr:hypothetical protein [Bacteroidota bacterium]